MEKAGRSTELLKRDFYGKKTYKVHHSGSNNYYVVWDLEGSGPGRSYQSDLSGAIELTKKSELK
jgi:hypothetical protein